MHDYIVTGDDDETAAAEIQAHAEAFGWGGVRPETQQRIHFRSAGYDAVVQRRGAFWFAYSAKANAPRVSGPTSGRMSAVREVISGAWLAGAA